MLAAVVAHMGGDEEVVGAVLGLVVVVGGGLAVMLMQQRPGAGSRRGQMAVLAATVLLVAAVTTLPSVMHACNDWRDRLLVATSGLVSASGSGSDTTPGLSVQDHQDLQRRVAEVLDERPFGCV